jgi:hypothetical protein
MTDKPLYFHPLASLFPLMNGTKFDELVADIKARGLREQITLYQGKVLDGRNRYRACLKLKLAPQVDLFTGTGCEFTQFDGDDDDARAYVISKNICRRHLTAKQRRDLLVKLVAAQPEKSDRAIAAEAKVDHHQVARARKKAEATGTKVPVEKRTGADGKKRKQPALKSRSKSDDIGKVPPLNQAVAFADVVGSAGERGKAAVFAPDTGPENGELARLRERNAELEHKVRRLELAHASEIEELKAAARSPSIATARDCIALLLQLIRSERWGGIAAESLAADPQDLRVISIEIESVWKRWFKETKKKAKAKSKQPVEPATVESSPVDDDGLDIPESLRRVVH